MVWNAGLTKETDERVRKFSIKCSIVKKRLFKENKLIPHNKGKTKSNYRPLKKVGKKVKGKKNGMYGKLPWNKGLTKLKNPELVTYGCKKENHWHWQGGCDRHELDKLSWIIKREKIRRRDNYSCRCCGSPAVDVHHKIPWRVSRDNSDSNLVTLCKKCHGVFDGYYDNHKIPLKI